MFDDSGSTLFIRCPFLRSSTLPLDPNYDHYAFGAVQHAASECVGTKTRDNGTMAGILGPEQEGALTKGAGIAITGIRRCMVFLVLVARVGVRWRGLVVICRYGLGV